MFGGQHFSKCACSLSSGFTEPLNMEALLKEVVRDITISPTIFGNTKALFIWPRVPETKMFENLRIFIPEKVLIQFTRV